MTATVGLYLAARAGAQDTLHFAHRGRVTIRDMSAVSWQPLKAGIRVKTVVGGVGSFSLGEFDAGVGTTPHHHTREQVNVGLTGSLEMMVDAQTFQLTRAANVIVPSNVPHAIRNASSSVASVLEFHTVRRVDLVPPRPQTSFPSAKAPARLGPSDNVFTPYDSTTYPMTVSGFTCSVGVRRIGANSVYFVGEEPGERFLYVLQGSGSVVSRGGKRPVSAGYLVIIPSNSPSVEVRDGNDLILISASVKTKPSVP